MNYRSATLSDASMLTGMNVELIRDEGHRNPMSEAELLVRMTGWLAGECQAILFEDHDGPGGYALFRRETEWVYLRQFFVAPARRRQGVGRAAILWLLENVWRDETRIRLEVLTGNSVAIDFWRSLGFADYCLTMEWAR